MTKKIKLVHIISILQLGGAESVLASLIDQLGDKDFEHHVIYFHSGPSVTRIQERGIPVYHIKGAIMLCDPVFWVRLFTCIKAIKPDLIHAHLWAANLSARIIGKLLGIPAVNTIHNKLMFQGAFRNTIDFVSLPLADAVVGIGSVVVSSGKRFPYDEKKMECIPNGIDVDAIQKRAHSQQQSREQFGWTDKEIVFGSVGRFEEQKNYHTLLEAFASLNALYPHTRLLLVGSGSQEEALRVHAQELGIKDVVQFVVGKTAYGYYSLMNAFVLSSHYEGLSIALLEAVSCGVPCITTGNHGRHEIISTESTGILIQKPSVEAVFYALKEFMLLKDQGKAFAACAQALVREHYSLTAMATAYKELYKRLMI
ncbi:MAG: glycosyltransferase [Candidatus Babeliales bacterium]